jgi:hypothetical protein
LDQGGHLEAVVAVVAQLCQLNTWWLLEVLAQAT